VESRGSAARVVRVGAMLVIVLTAFAAGLALRGWDDEGGAPASAPPKPIDEVRVERAIRLLRADPGTLHRPERAPTPVGASTPAAAPVLESGPPVAPTPVPTPAPEPPAAPEPTPAATPIGTFDSEG
jgi:hypothetical protein